MVSDPRAVFRGGDWPWIIAHRGDSAHAPENTLEAALRGHRAGADAWELDVQLTRDGVPVVLHDPSLRRTTDVARRFAGDAREAAGFLVSDFDLDEIRALDAGSWFLDPGGGPRSARHFGTLDALGPEDHALFGSGRVRVPTLAEALALTARLGWKVNVELKSGPAHAPGLVEAVLALIPPGEAAGRVWLSSFDHADVARVVQLRPDLPAGVLVSTPLHRPAAYVRDWVGAAAYHPAAEALGSRSDAYRRRPSPTTLRTADLHDLRAADVPTFVFTVNDGTPGGLAEHLASAGASGLFTDDPAALVAARGRGAVRPGRRGRR